MKRTQRITVLCIAINCIEGTDVAQDYEKQNESVVKTLNDCLIKEATILYHQGVTLKHLSDALYDGGWEENYFVLDHKRLKIKDGPNGVIEQVTG